MLRSQAIEARLETNVATGACGGFGEGLGFGSTLSLSFSFSLSVGLVGLLALLVTTGGAGGLWDLIHARNSSSFSVAAFPVN